MSEKEDQQKKLAEEKCLVMSILSPLQEDPELTNFERLYKQGIGKNFRDVARSFQYHDVRSFLKYAMGDSVLVEDRHHRTYVRLLPNKKISHIEKMVMHSRPQHSIGGLRKAIPRRSPRKRTPSITSMSSMEEGECRESRKEKNRYHRSPGRRSKSIDRRRRSPSNDRARVRRYHSPDNGYASRSTTHTDRDRTDKHRELQRDNISTKVNLPDTRTLTQIRKHILSNDIDEFDIPPKSMSDVNVVRPLVEPFKITSRNRPPIVETRPFDPLPSPVINSEQPDTLKEPRKVSPMVHDSYEETSLWGSITPVTTEVTSTTVDIKYRNLNFNDPYLTETLISFIRGYPNGVDITRDFENKFTEAFKIKIIYSPVCSSMLSLLLTLASSQNLMIDMSRNPHHATYCRSVSNYVPVLSNKSITFESDSIIEFNASLPVGVVKLGTIIPTVADSWVRNHVYEAKIRKITNPSNIYVTMVNYPGFKSLHNSMQNAYNNLGPLSAISIVDKEMYVVTKLAGIAYRAKIVDIFQGEVVCCQVYCIDLGESRIVIKNELFHLFEQFSHIPAQAAFVRLCVTPMNQDSQWSPEIVEDLKESIKNKTKCYVQYFGLKVNGGSLVDIVTSELGSLTKFIKSRPQVGLMNPQHVGNVLDVIEITEARYAPQCISRRNQYGMPTPETMSNVASSTTGDDDDLVVLYECTRSPKIHYTTEIIVGLNTSAKMSLVLINYENKPYFLWSEVLHKYSKLYPGFNMNADYKNELKNIGFLHLNQQTAPMLIEELCTKYNTELNPANVIVSLIPPDNVVLAIESINRLKLPHYHNENFQHVIRKFNPGSSLWVRNKPTEREPTLVVPKEEIFYHQQVECIDL